MKAIVLTYAPVNKEEKELLKNTNVFKIATNFSATELKPNLRLTADNIVKKCLECDTCDVVSVNYDLERKRVINACYLPNWHSSLLFCINYLYLKGYTKVLLVATNPDSKTCKINYEGVNIMKDCLYLYKYTKDGYFDIPYKSIKEFLMLSDEEKLLGEKEITPKKILEKTIFTSACRYEVHTKGKNNKSIVSGEVIKNILPVSLKDLFLLGSEEMEYNGLVIKKITKMVPEVITEEKTEEVITEEKTEENKKDSKRKQGK